MSKILAYFFIVLMGILDLIRSITDPEHPLTLEELAVVSASQLQVSPNHILVEFTPTVPHCGASTLIGIKSRGSLLRSYSNLNNRTFHSCSVASQPSQAIQG